MTNKAFYDAAMDAARLLSGNFKLVRQRKRALALDLVRSSVVEGFSLQDTITDAKKALKWTKLASDEQNQMNVLFSAVRVIDGAWKSLSEEQRKTFLAGELIYSTLAKAIKDEEKAALQKAADADDKSEAGEQAREDSAEQAREEHPVDPVLLAMRQVSGWLDEADMDSMSDGQLKALSDLSDAIDQFRAAALAKAEAKSKSKKQA